MYPSFIRSQNIDDLYTSSLASDRLRLSFIVDAILSCGYHLTIGLNIPKSAQIVFVGKLTEAFGEKIINNVFDELRSFNGKIVVDYTDNWLLRSGTVTFEIYTTLLPMAHYVTVPVTDLQFNINNTQIKTFVIPDGLDQFDFIAPKIKDNAIKEVIWFGHISNILSLLKYLDSSFGLNKFKLNIVSDHLTFDFIMKYNFKLLRGFEICLHMWSIENLLKISKNCDLKLLPTDKNMQEVIDC